MYLLASSAVAKEPWTSGEPRCGGVKRSWSTNNPGGTAAGAAGAGAVMTGWPNVDIATIVWSWLAGGVGLLGVLDGRRLLA